MFRRFEKMFVGDMTPAYSEALQARGFPHVLVGGKSFNEREEVGTMRSALAALEWPDDTPSVYATLRGFLFAISDADLLAYRTLGLEIDVDQGGQFRFGELEIKGMPVAHREILLSAWAKLRGQVYNQKDAYDFFNQFFSSPLHGICS